MGAIYLISILVCQGQKQILVVIKMKLLFTVFSKLKFYLCLYVLVISNDLEEFLFCWPGCVSIHPPRQGQPVSEGNIAIYNILRFIIKGYKTLEMNWVMFRTLKAFIYSLTNLAIFLSLPCGIFFITKNLYFIIRK